MASMARKLVISTVIIIALVALSFGLFFPSKNGLGEFFSLSIVFMAVSYVSIGIGVLIIALRALNIIRNSTGLLSIFFGEINTAFGFIAIVLYCTQNANHLLLRQGLLNLLIGVVLLTDSFILRISK